MALWSPFFTVLTHRRNCKSKADAIVRSTATVLTNELGSATPHSFTVGDGQRKQKVDRIPNQRRHLIGGSRPFQASRMEDAESSNLIGFDVWSLACFGFLLFVNGQVATINETEIGRRHAFLIISFFCCWHFGVARNKKKIKKERKRNRAACCVTGLGKAAVVFFSYF